MIEDLAHAAYQAVRDSDRTATLATVAEIIARGDIATNHAMHLWMDRTLAVIGDVGDVADLRVRMVSDHSPTGEPHELHEVIPEIAWAGQMFAAHLNRDAAMCWQLWSLVPAREVTAYVSRLLTTMVTTALAYEEDSQPYDCCSWHTWLHRDPDATGQRIAKAHLN